MGLVRSLSDCALSTEGIGSAQVLRKEHRAKKLNTVRLKKVNGTLRSRSSLLLTAGGPQTHNR